MVRKSLDTNPVIEGDDPWRRVKGMKCIYGLGRYWSQGGFAEFVEENLVPMYNAVHTSVHFEFQFFAEQDSLVDRDRPNEWQNRVQHGGGGKARDHTLNSQPVFSSLTGTMKVYRRQAVNPCCLLLMTLDTKIPNDGQPALILVDTK